MKKYYYTECERYQYRGKIYQKHLWYKKKKESNSILIKEINPLDWEKLRPIAQKQIYVLFKKLSNSRRPILYKREINKVILHERSIHDN